MTESKPPSSNRIQRPSLLPNPTVLGHTFSGNQFQPPLRHKISQALQSTGASMSASPALSTNAGSNQFHVTVPLGPPKDQLTVMTSYQTKPAASGAPTVKAFSSLDKIPITLSATSEMRIKANVRNVEIQNVSYIKQPMGSTVKSIVVSSPNVVQATIKKDVDVNKARPVLIGQGLRPPLKSHHNPKANVLIDPRAIPRSTTSHPIWSGSQSEPMKNNAAAPVVRTKTPFHNATVAISTQDLSKKHGLQPQIKSTINISATAHIPLRESQGQRNAGFTVAPLPGNKPIYQVFTDLPAQAQGNSIKKISAMIVCQPSSMTLGNSICTSSGFVSSNNALSSGHITIMTSSDSVTYMANSNPPNGTAVSAIPVAKVYPQPQISAKTKIPVTSTTSTGRLSVPVMSSVGGPLNRGAPSLIQVGPIKSTCNASINTTSQSVNISAMPASAGSKSPASSGSVLWPSYSQTFALSTVTTTPSLRTNLTHSIGHSQPLPLSGTIRVQPTNVLLMESKAGHLQSPGGSSQAVSQENRPNTVPRSPSQAGVGAATPTQSPKPTILRRQRLENNNALKKLTFGGSAGYSAPKRTAADRRPVPGSLSRPKIGGNDVKLDLPVLIHSDHTEIKPVMENPVFVKSHLAGVSAPLKRIGISNMKGLASPSSNSAKDGGAHAYSIHPALDPKTKMEHMPGQKVTVKTEPASASQMLLLQNQAMHTYAAESPPAPSAPHKTVSQESGHHITTNTIFTKPIAMYPGQQHNAARTKAAAGNAAQDAQRRRHAGHVVNSFSAQSNANLGHDRPPAHHDYTKKDPARMKTPEARPSSGALNQAHANHILSNVRPWTAANASDPLAGLSPRKRPRKQTHVVSEDQSVVMEDEESTDDADECEDEPSVRQAASQFFNPTTSAAASAKHSNDAQGPASSSKPNKSEPPCKKAHIDESRSRAKGKAEHAVVTSESKPQSVFTDQNGVRYVVNRKRPSVSVLYKPKPNSRSINNHFMHYSDVRAKDKKTTIADLAQDKKRLKGYNVARFALQLQDMVSCETEIWDRMQAVFDGLVEYKSTHLSESTFDAFVGSSSPATPTQSPGFFRNPTPRGHRFGSGSTVENGPAQSPCTPLDRKTNRVKDDILNIEELAMANLQRCEVVTEQLTDTKATLLKAVGHRQLVSDILESTNNQKSSTTASHLSAGHSSSKRLKKKNAS